MMFPASKTQNKPKRCAGNVPEWHIQNVLTFLPMIYQFRKFFGKLPGHCKEMSGKLENPGHFDTGDKGHLPSRQIVSFC